MSNTHNIFSTVRNYEVLTSCPICHKHSTVVISRHDWYAWNIEGVRINEAFPYLSDNERELLITGICASCWDNMFEEEEDEI